MIFQIKEHHFGQYDEFAKRCLACRSESTEIVIDEIGTDFYILSRKCNDCSLLYKIRELNPKQVKSLKQKHNTVLALANLAKIEIMPSGKWRCPTGTCVARTSRDKMCESCHNHHWAREL
jgi:hypothetical protein